jgi:GTP-binding protein
MALLGAAPDKYFVRCLWINRNFALYFYMQKIRNIAIIAHVDHGKTTLVDKILHTCKLFRDNQQTGELILDNNDLERERGITITAKNVSVTYKGYKINILDTPGHSDFGGEVERVLKMADGVLLLVDAFEGPMPQTRFVLKKALELRLKPIVIINKVDKPNCRPEETLDKLVDLLFALDADESQLEFKTIYGSGKGGWMGPDWKNPTTDITYLLDTILTEIPEAVFTPGDFQMQVTSLDYSAYVGRIAIGRINRGIVKEGQEVVLINREGVVKKNRIKEVHLFEGLGRLKVTEAHAGDICALVGLEGFDIGDTVATVENPEAMAAIKVDEPTLSMLFTINNSPFFGKEGKFVTSRHLRDRLFKETEKNLALRVEETDSPDSYMVFGRGILHLAVLIETMRREGYELMVGQPQVIIKEIDGVKCEPIEHLVVDVIEEYAGKVIEMVTARKGELTIMEPKGDSQHLEFIIPSRGLIGLRSNMLTATRGEANMSHRFVEYQPLRQMNQGRQRGVLISMGTGPAVPYSLFQLQDRGTFFVDPGVEVYGGQVIGENIRIGDLIVNVQKTKQLTNVRASGTDDAVTITPPVRMSLEQCMEYIDRDEYVEVTPKSIRIRKIWLDENERKKNSRKES